MGKGLGSGSVLVLGLGFWLGLGLDMWVRLIKKQKSRDNFLKYDLLVITILKNKWEKFELQKRYSLYSGVYNLTQMSN